MHYSALGVVVNSALQWRGVVVNSAAHLFMDVLEEGLRGTITLILLKGVGGPIPKEDTDNLLWHYYVN